MALSRLSVAFYAPRCSAALPNLPILPEASADLTGLARGRELAPSLRIMLDERLYEQVKRLAGIMAKDSVFTPKHLQSKPEACFTVITQSVNWNLDPSFVARATYQTPGGSIGFEGKLTQAILEQSGRFVGGPKLKYVGDWSKLTGKFEKATSQRGNEYVKRTWTDKDAQGLGITVSWQVKGEAEPRIWPGEDDPFYLTQCFPLNSTLWATDPKTQIGYLALRRFASSAVPGIFGGMSFDHEEMFDAAEQARDVTPAPPPRPRREDFADKPMVTDVEPADPFLVVDGFGNEIEYPDRDDAVAAYNAALDEAEQQRGEAGLTAMFDNNGPFFKQLEERSAADLSRELSLEYGRRRQAAAARAADTKRDPPPADRPGPDGATANLTPGQPGQGGTSAPGGDLFANRDPAFWQRPDGKRLLPAEPDAFMRDLPGRMAECRMWAEVDDIERHNAAMIRKLSTDDRVEVARLFAARREQLRGEG